MKANNENAFTLVEILAALTILGIVFISYMTIFPQMVSMNERTEIKLETMNIAKQLLNDVKESEEGSLPEIYVYQNTDKVKKEVHYKGQKDGYQIELTCLPKDKKSPMCNSTGTNDLNLYKIHIQVKKQEKLISETFGYVELN